MVADSRAPFAGKKTIRVLIVDDQQAVRRGLHIRLSLEPEVEIIGEARDGAEAISLAGSLQPDVVLMDARMPGMDGIEATAALRAVARESAVVILSLDDDAKTRTRQRRPGRWASVPK